MPCNRLLSNGPIRRNSRRGHGMTLASVVDPQLGAPSIVSCAALNLPAKPHFTMPARRQQAQAGGRWNSIFKWSGNARVLSARLRARDRRHTCCFPGRGFRETGRPEGRQQCAPRPGTSKDVQFLGPPIPPGRSIQHCPPTDSRDEDMFNASVFRSERRACRLLISAHDGTTRSCQSDGVAGVPRAPR